MAGFSTELERNVNLQLGSKAFGPFLIDNDVRSVAITFDRTNWTNPAARLDVSLECSIDNGPFRFMTGFTAIGSQPIPDRPQNVSFIRVTLPSGGNRRVQGVYAVSGQRIRTTVTLTGETS